MVGPIVRKLALLLAVLAPIALHAQAIRDITGNWQGTLEAQKSLRTILVISKTDKGLAAKFYSIDQDAQSFNAKSVTLNGNAFKFDFTLTFSPNDSLFNGHPPKMPPAADTTGEPAPDFFLAFQQQLGLKLDAEKAPVDVLVIDHVDKPSANLKVDPYRNS